MRDDGSWGAAQLETIVHPNEYFKRSYLLKHIGRAGCEGCPSSGAVKVEAPNGNDVKMEDV